MRDALLNADGLDLASFHNNTTRLAGFDDRVSLRSQFGDLVIRDCASRCFCGTGALACVFHPASQPGAAVPHRASNQSGTLLLFS
jgi:hypothetical protein